MLKGGILNPKLNYELSQVSHMDEVMICDAGMPVPPGVDRVDLEFIPGQPDIVTVLKEIVKTLTIQGVYLAEEIRQSSPDLDKQYHEIFRGIAEIKYIPHVQIKTRSSRARVAIKTGEFHYHYSSLLLVAGCSY